MLTKHASFHQFALGVDSCSLSACDWSTSSPNYARHIEACALSQSGLSHDVFTGAHTIYLQHLRVRGGRGGACCSHLTVTELYKKQFKICIKNLSVFASYVPSLGWCVFQSVFIPSMHIALFEFFLCAFLSLFGFFACAFIAGFQCPPYTLSPPSHPLPSLRTPRSRSPSPGEPAGDVHREAGAVLQPVQPAEPVRPGGGGGGTGRPHPAGRRAGPPPAARQRARPPADGRGADATLRPRGRRRPGRRHRRLPLPLRKGDGRSLWVFFRIQKSMQLKCINSIHHKNMYKIK